MSRIVEKLGSCIICGSKVVKEESYLKAREGYCHRSCVIESSVTA